MITGKGAVAQWVVHAEVEDRAEQRHATERSDE
jgi:hypothetical protein